MSLKFAVLGFLTFKPMTGYELHGHFNGTASHFWPADQSQIYRTLADLERDGLVESERIPQAARPDRREYRLLASGREAYEQWLASPLEGDVVREPFLLRLFFVGAAGPEAALRLVDERLVAARGSLAALEAVEASLGVAVEAARTDLGQRLRIATLQNGLAHTRTEIRWLEDLRRELRRR